MENTNKERILKIASNKKIQYMDGLRLNRAIIAGIRYLISRQDYLNKINVFPVPDGDTGTNMSFTMNSVLEEAIDKIEPRVDIFTKNISEGKKIIMPIAHKQGNYIAKSDTLKELKDNDQIIFKYNDNPNGSVFDIAGITNRKRNILGMMPHPERASDNLLGYDDGKLIFESVLNNYE